MGNVVEALHTIGIDLSPSDDFCSVIEKVADAWDGLSDEKQKDISNELAAE